MQLVHGGLGSLRGLSAEKAPVAALVFELHEAGDEREERVVLALTNVFARLVLGPTLAVEDRARVDELPAEALPPQPLPVRIAAVCRGAAALLMCHDIILFDRNGRAKAGRYKKQLELDIADLDGRVILPVATLNLVLIGLLELEDGDFLGASLRDDLTGHGRFGSVRTQNYLFFVGVDGKNRTERDFFAHFSRNPLNTNGVAGRDAILLSPGLNDGVHLPSKSLRQTPIIGVSGPNRQRTKMRGSGSVWNPS